MIINILPNLVTMSKNYINYLLFKKNSIRDEINNYDKLKKQLNNEIKEIEKQLFKQCVHNFYRYGEYDDICKFRCKKCNCFSNENLYK